MWKLDRVVLVAGVALSATACVDQSTTPPQSPEASVANAAVGPAAQVRRSSNPAVPDQYIVVLRDHVRNVPGVANAMAQSYGGTDLQIYQHALKGFRARMSAQAAEALLNNPNVDFVEQDAIFTIRGHTIQESAPWGLDRIDQRDLPLNDTFIYSSTGAGVNIYIVDSGIRMTHNDFGGRASLGIDFIDDGLNGGDCNGHGTHVAGNAGGATWGVAKEANLISVRVADCAPSGFASNAIAAIDWITANAVAPAVANLSFGWPVSGPPTAVEIAVSNSIAAGIFYAGATDNARIEACEDFPSRIAELMTVARTNILDRMVANTGFGPCIDIFGPGQAIPSAAITSDDAMRTANGTSYATPHVAGVAALHLQDNPSWTPAQVMAQILGDATLGRIGTDTNGDPLPEGTPDRLLFMPIDNSPPIADHGGPYAGDEGSPVSFDAGGSSDPDGDPITFGWDFGDGNTGTGVTPSHTYLDDGVYTVTLTVSDGLAETVVTTTATIANVAPIVDAGPDASITSNELFHFSGTFSDPGILDDPWSWTIDWDDETTTAGSTNNQALPILASHQFCAAGGYTVSLTVVDKDGGSGSDQMILTVNHLGVEIVVKPSEDPNSVGLSGRGLLPVAVLSSADFDATQIDAATVTLGDEVGSDTPVAQRPNGQYYAEIEDVNGDGLPDVVFRFRVPELVANGDLTAASTSLVLRGFLGNGCTNFRGEDSVRVVP